MSRTATPLRPPQPTRTAGSPAANALPGLPRSPLTTEQQLAALKRVQEQADQRVKLGAQFFKAAEARTGEYRQILDQLKAEHESLRGQMQQDVTRSFHTYDQWIGEMEDNFAAGLHTLESKIDRLQSEWAQTQQRIASMMRRSEAMLDQCRSLLDTPGTPAPGSAPGNITVPAPVSAAIPGTAGSVPKTPPVIESLTVSARDVLEPVPILATRPVTAPLVECPARPAERLHPAPPPPPVAPLPVDEVATPAVDATTPVADAPTCGNSIADAIASTDEDIESPEFYRQVLEKLREQDEMTTP